MLISFSFLLVLVCICALRRAEQRRRATHPGADRRYKAPGREISQLFPIRYFREW